MAVDAALVLATKLAELAAEAWVAAPVDVPYVPVHIGLVRTTVLADAALVNAATEATRLNVELCVRRQLKCTLHARVGRRVLDP